MSKVKINKSLCTGCRICELVCSMTKHSEFNLSRAHCRTTWKEELVPNTPVFCVQCKNAKCVEACPENAIHRDDENGIVHINYDLCTRCKVCIEACPFNAMFTDAVTGYPVKCDTCNRNPVCVSHCHSSAISLVDS